MGHFYEVELNSEFASEFVNDCYDAICKKFGTIAEARKYMTEAKKELTDKIRHDARYTKDLEENTITIDITKFVCDADGYEDRLGVVDSRYICGRY